MGQILLGVLGTLVTGLLGWLLVRTGRHIIDLFEVLPTEIELTRSSVARDGAPILEGGAAQLRATVIRTRFGKSVLLFHDDVRPGAYHLIPTRPGKFRIEVRWIRWDGSTDFSATTELHLPSGRHEFQVGTNPGQVYLRRVAASEMRQTGEARQMAEPRISRSAP